MSKQDDKWDTWLDDESESDDAFVRRDQSFEPVGLSDWKAALLEGLTPEKAYVDELANPTMFELGGGFVR